MASYWQSEVLADVVGLLKESRLYLFAGAGLSCLAGYPSWKELLRRFSEAYKALPGHKVEIKNELDALVERRDLAVITHLLLLGEPGEDAFVRVLTDTFEEVRTSEVHRMLVKLPFTGFITINYDRCFELACEGANGASELNRDRWFCFPKHRVAENMDMNELYRGSKFLLHMHGCLYHGGQIDSKNIILTKEQYGSFYATPEMDRIYRDLLSKPMLLLGTSFSDRNFLQKLYDCRGHHDRDLRTQRGMCYLVLPRSERRNTEYSEGEEYGVKFSYYEDEDSSALEKMIRELTDTYKGDVRKYESFL